MVDVVVRMHQRRTFGEGAAEQLRGAVSDDLVGVGVGRGSGTGLKDVQDELIVKSTRWLGDLIGGFGDGVGLVWFEQAEVAIGARGGGFDGAECPDEASIETFAADREILDRALRGSSV